MLLLFETPAGHALFKVSDSKVAKTDVSEISGLINSADKATKLMSLQAFSQFEGTADAVAAATDTIEGKLGKNLKKFLTKHLVKKEATEELGVMDAKLGAMIKDKLGVQCVWDKKVFELTRGVREHQEALLNATLPVEDMKAIQLGLAHSLSRYKLKFSPDKVDVMIVQAIGLLDELDKEINTYAMRVREWYGWHFPELVKVVPDNMQYARCVMRMGMRAGAAKSDFSDIFEDEAVIAALKEVAEISMGTEITEPDLLNIRSLAENVVSMAEYRLQLSEYLKNRMNAIAPNLTIMVGELVGARLISHAGSLMNLAKHPASTVQILGAEKALFRALKTKHDTPKYGLIYHASLVGQAAPKHKGRISRVLAAKAALAIRVDAIGEESGATIAYAARAKVEERLRQLDGGAGYVPPPKEAGGAEKYQKVDGGAKAPVGAAFVGVDEGGAAPETEKKKKKKDKKEGEDGEKSEKKKKKRKASE